MLLLLEAVLSVEGDYVCAQVSVHCSLPLDGRWVGWRGSDGEEIEIGMKIGEGIARGLGRAKWQEGKMAG